MKTKPVKENHDVGKSNDAHISQDFPGFPHSPSNENIIKKYTTNENNGKKISSESKPEKSTLKTKHLKIGNKNTQSDKADLSDGSANAFDETENVNEAGKSDEDNNDLSFRKDK